MHVPSRVIGCYLVCGRPEATSLMKELRPQKAEKEIPRHHLARPDAAKGKCVSFPMMGDHNIDRDILLGKPPIFSCLLQAYTSKPAATPILDTKNHL